MPISLLHRLRPDSIDEFDAAADERFRDAVRLADADRRTAAIYLFGYAVEMLLKAGSLRLVGYADVDPVTTAALRQYIGVDNNSIARSLGMAGTKNLHDLTSWAELVVAYRSAHGPKYSDVAFADALRTHVKTIHRFWSESLRYHRNIAYNYEVEQVRSASQWVIDNRAGI